MILAALHDAGGKDYFRRQAEQCPVAFLTLLGKVLPLQLTSDNGRPAVIEFRWADKTPQRQRLNPRWSNIAPPPPS